MLKNPTFIPHSRFREIEIQVNNHSLDKPEDGTFSLEIALEYAKVRYRITGMTKRPIMDRQLCAIRWETGAYAPDIIFTLNTVAHLDIPAERIMENLGFDSERSEKGCKDE